MPSKLLISASSLPAVVFLIYDYLLNLNSGENLNLKGIAVSVLCTLFFFISIHKGKLYLSLSKAIVALLILSVVSNFIYVYANGLNGMHYILIKLLLLASLYIFSTNIDEKKFVSFFKVIFVLTLLLAPFYVLFGQGPPIFAALPYLILSRHKACFWFYVLLLVSIAYYYVDRGLLLVLLIIATIRLIEFNFKFKKRHITYTLLIILVMVVILQFVIALSYSNNSLANILLTKRPYIWGLYIDTIINSDYINQILGSGRIDNNVATYIGKLVGSEFGHGRSYTSHSFYINTLYEYGLLGFMLFIAYLLKIIIHTNEKNFSVTYIIMMFLILGLVTPFSLFGITGISIIFSLIFMYSVKNFKKVVK